MAKRDPAIVRIAEMQEFAEQLLSITEAAGRADAMTNALTELLGDESGGSIGAVNASPSILGHEKMEEFAARLLHTVQVARQSELLATALGEVIDAWNKGRLGAPPPPPPKKFGLTDEVVAPPELASTPFPDSGLPLEDTVRGYEIRLIDQALARTGGNRTHAAVLLRINRTTLVQKIRAWEQRQAKK